MVTVAPEAIQAREDSRRACLRIRCRRGCMSEGYAQRGDPARDSRLSAGRGRSCVARGRVLPPGWPALRPSPSGRRSARLRRCGGRARPPWQALVVRNNLRGKPGDDADAGARQFARHWQPHRHDAAFGGGVGRLPDLAAGGCRRRGVDDHASSAAGRRLGRGHQVRGMPVRELPVAAADRSLDGVNDDCFASTHFVVARFAQAPETRRCWPAQCGSRSCLRSSLPTTLFGSASVVNSTTVGFLYEPRRSEQVATT